jgi:hypothetical protein
MRLRVSWVLSTVGMTSVALEKSNMCLDQYVVLEDATMALAQSFATQHEW